MKRVGCHVFGVWASALPRCATMHRVALCVNSMRACATRAQHTSGFAVQGQSQRPRYASQRHARRTSQPTSPTTTAQRAVRYRSQQAQTSSVQIQSASADQTESKQQTTSTPKASTSSTSSVMERATVMQRSHMTPEEQRHALHRLNLSMRDATRAIEVRALRSKMYEATLALDTNKKYIARGVATSAKAARRECAAHALCMLEILRQDKLARDSGTSVAQGVQLNDISTATTNTSANSSASTKEDKEGNMMASEAARSAPLGAMLNSLTPRLATVYRLFCYLVKDEDDSSSSTAKVHFRRDTSTNAGSKTPGYVCRLSVHGMTCEGSGVNRFEAERAALESVITELSLHDTRMQALFRLVTRCPHLVPECIPSATMPQELAGRIRDVVTAMAARNDEENESTTKKKEKERPTSVEHGAAKNDMATLDETDRQTRIEAALSTRAALQHDPDYAATMRAQLHAMHQSPRYVQLFQPRRTTLAMHAVAETIVSTVRAQRVTIICGTTGCGKSTQVPQYLLDDAIERLEGDRCNILVTQPRRLSAFGIAERVAQERLSHIGEDIGYMVRLDAQPGRHVTFCTTGVLLQMLVSQPDLSHVSHLIIDEVHERDLNCDTLLALVKAMLQRNTTLRVVLMSATMQADLFAAYFDNAPIITVDGAVYPVAERFLDDIAAEFAGPMQQKHTTTNNNNSTNTNNSSSKAFYSPMFGQLAVQSAELRRSPRIGSKAALLIPPKTDYRLIAHLVHHAATTHLAGRLASASILIFLPGWRELLQAKQAIESYTMTSSNHSDPPLRFHIILLHSSVESAKQRECFEPAPAGHVKVILATNIAESGITIDDVAVVIDTGLIKQTTWTCRTQRPYSTSIVSGDERSNNSEAGVQVFSTQLALSYASKANATQRKGRAGRTQGGICYRLFSRATWQRLPAYAVAEIHRTALTQVLLKLLYLGHIAPRQTLQGFLEPPSSLNVEASMRQLQALGAIDAEEQLTPLGRYLSQLPCDPRVGKMILLGAVLRCLDSVLTLAACEEASPYVGSRDDAAKVRQRRYLFARGSESDHVSALNAYNAFCANHESAEFARMNYLNVGNLYTIAKYKAQFRDILLSAGFCGLDDVYATTTSSRWLSTSINNTLGGDAAVMSRYQGSLCVLDGPLSQNALNVSLVKACVCGSLFPNVAMLEPSTLTSSETGAQQQQQGRQRRRLQRLRPARKLALRTKVHAHIIPSKDSACRRIGGPSPSATVPSRAECMKALMDDNTSEDNMTSRMINGGAQAPLEKNAAGTPAKPAMFYVYEDVFVLPEARQRFLTGVSSVSLWALLLFGVSEARMIYEEAVQLCVIDGWMAIRMDELTYRTLRGLRHTLELCIWQKYVNPHDAMNNAAMETLCQLSKELLSSPCEQAGAMYRLSDVGVIVSPTALQSGTISSSELLNNTAPTVAERTVSDDSEEDDMSDDARYGWDDDDEDDDDHVYTV